MKKFFLFISLTVFSCVISNAQFSNSSLIDIAESRNLRIQKQVAPLYRKPSKEELKAVEPSPELFEKYAEFLRQPKTGLIRLIDDKGCSDNMKIVVATDDCLKYTMPGAGSSFSFRIENYRIPRLADLTFTNKSFQASGIYVHGIFVNLGDVPLGEINLQTKGLQYLTDFQPEPEFEKSREIDQQLMKGIERDGFLYRRGLYITENTTFALRSIAYGGKYYRAVSGITYNELDFDKRQDIIVIFRIVQKDEEGNVTILWKEIREKDSPGIITKKTKK